MHVTPDFRNRKIRISIYPYYNPYSHNDQTESENRINLSDDLIDGNKRCNKVIRQYKYKPEKRRT